MTGKRAMLRIGPGLALPAAEFVESKSAILGQSGTGKSGALKVIQEELVRAKKPFIVFDPAGVAWGIRSSKDGKGPGLPVLVIGGEHGDFPLNKDAGAETATALVENNASVVIDLSQETEGASRKFIAEFCHALWVAQGKSRTPRLIIIDEAHEVLPQDVSKMDAVSFGAVKKIVTRGRNRGIGVCLVSQRPAGIAKSVLTQCGSLFVFGVLGTPDLKAVGEWIHAWGGEEKQKVFMDGLASLKVQECWFWSPREFGIFKHIRIRDFETFHPDFTHLRREGLMEVQAATYDVASLAANLKGVLAKVHGEKVDIADVPRVRAQLARTQELLMAAQGRVAHLEASQGPKGAEHQEALRQLGESKAHVERLRGEVAALRKWETTVVVPAYQKILASVTQMGEHLQEVPSQEHGDGWRRAGPAVLAPAHPVLTSVTTAAHHGPKWATPAKQRTVVNNTILLPNDADAAPHEESGDDGGVDRPLKSGALRMLGELVARMPEAMSDQNLGTLAGFSPRAGTFRGYVSALKRRGYVDRPSPGMLRATASGAQQVADVPRLPQSKREVLALWQPKMKSGMYRMLEIISESPAGIGREDLGNRAGFTHEAGTFRGYLSFLRRTGLVQTEGDLVRPAGALLL